MKDRIINRIRLFTALSGIVLALAGFAQAGVPGTQDSQKAAKTKRGTLKIVTATDVGGLRLAPGEYEVEQVNSAAGTVVRFTRYTYDPYAQEGVSAHEWETVGEAKVTVQPLASKAKHTQLLVASNGGQAVGMEISGNSAEYLF